jgi:hypothetical protein
MAMRGIRTDGFIVGPEDDGGSPDRPFIYHKNLGAGWVCRCQGVEELCPVWRPPSGASVPARFGRVSTVGTRSDILETAFADQSTVDQRI